MSLDTLISVLSLALRLLQQLAGLLDKFGPVLGRARKKPPKPAPPLKPEERREAARPSPPSPPGRGVGGEGQKGEKRRRWLGPTLSALFAACVAGAAAYVVMRQRQRRIARRKRVHAPFPEELLDVLARPGGEGRFFFTGDGLLDPSTDTFVPVADGIPDFGPPASARRLTRYETSDWVDFYSLAVHNFFIPFVWQGNSVAIAALSSAVAAEAYDGWCLSVPCGAAHYEIEMARANPHAKLICLDGAWEMLLEGRRRALEAGLTNLYFVRGDAELLPLQSSVCDSVWSANGLHLCPYPERALTQMARVAKPGAIVAGVSLVPGGPLLPEVFLRLAKGRLPGLRDVQTHLSLIAGSGVRELRAYRSGAMVRFLGTRAATQT